MKINNLLQSLSYTPISAIKIAAIEDAVGDKLQMMLNELSSDKDSRYKDEVRSILMSVSDSVDQHLNNLKIKANYKDRIKIFLHNGKKIRGAFACLSKQDSTQQLKKEASVYIKNSFAQIKQEFDSMIAKKVHHVYATKSAVTFEATKSADGRSVLQVEAASRNESGNFNWKEKIVLQLNDKEIVQLVTVLRNWSFSCEFANHGSHRDKRMTFQSQAEKGYVISVRQGTTARVVPIQKIESLSIISMAMKVLHDNTSNLDTQNIFDIVRETVESVKS